MVQTVAQYKKARASLTAKLAAETIACDAIAAKIGKMKTEKDAVASTIAACRTALQIQYDKITAIANGRTITLPLTLQMRLDLFAVMSASEISSWADRTFALAERAEQSAEQLRVIGNEIWSAEYGLRERNLRVNSLTTEIAELDLARCNVLAHDRALLQHLRNDDDDEPVMEIIAVAMERGAKENFENFAN